MSDPDIPLATTPAQLPEGAGTLLQIENELDELLLPYKIDLCLLHKIENPDLVAHIRRVGEVFYPMEPTGC